MARIETPREPERSAKVRAVIAVVAFAGATIFGVRACLQAVSSSDPPGLDGLAPVAPPSAPAATPVEPPRCASLGADASFVVGEAPPVRAGSDAGTSPFDDPPEEADLSPFAVEIGRGAVFDGGFAVGALRDAEGGSVANVVTIGFDGRGGRVVRLARSRGDIDAPVVTGHGGSIIAAMLEPNAGGRALKIAKVTGDEVRWGLELAQGRDESLAFDVAASQRLGVAVWDDVGRDGKRSSIQLATFDPASMAQVKAAHPISDPKLDAESPRLLVRPGGFWLAYVVRQAGPRGVGSDEGDDEGDGSGEVIGHAWLAVMPLDEAGLPVSLAKRISPSDGHVLAFDLEPGDDGGAILAWRDDDTPTGSSGGHVSTALVTLGGAAEARVVAAEGVGPGLPDLLEGWFALSDLRGPKRLASMNGKGELTSELGAEPAIGAGEPLAVSNGAILVAHPDGRSMRLGVVRCQARPSAAERDGG